MPPLTDKAASFARTETEEGKPMAKYRKKPVVIEAVQWFPGVNHPGVRLTLPEVTLYGRGDDGSDLTYQPSHRAHVITVHEQMAFLEPGDWVIPEPKPDRFYPCKPDIFAATYDPVEASDVALGNPPVAR